VVQTKQIGDILSFIEIRNVNKSFNNQKTLENINLTIDEGSVLGILGKSGSGKSVLINMLRGMKDYQPDNGQIIYNIALCNDCLRVEPPSMENKKCKCGGIFKAERVDFWNCERSLFAAIRRRISIMLQRTFALYEDDTVIDNVLKWLDNGKIIMEGNPKIVVEKFMDSVPLPEKKTSITTTNPIIKIENVKKHYYSIERGVVKAVDGVDLVVNESEICSIVGLSGAGKTTPPIPLVWPYLLNLVKLKLCMSSMQWVFLKTMQRPC